MKSSGTLRVGTETQFAPFDFLENGKATGLNYDLFAELGKDMGVKIEWVALPWESVLPGLEAGKFDMVAGPATITKARMERYRFNAADRRGDLRHPEEGGRRQRSASPRTSPARRSAPARRRRSSRSSRRYAATLSRQPQVREYVDFAQAYADLAAGRIVAVANSLPNIAYRRSAAARTRSRSCKPPFGDKSYFGYIGRKDAEYAGLMDAVDAAILKMKSDGRLAKLQEKWFKTTFETPDRVTNPAV